MTLQGAKLELKEKTQKQLLAVCRSKTSAPDSGHCATPGDPGHGQGHGVMVLHEKFQVLSPKNSSVKPLVSQKHPPLMVVIAQLKGIISMGKAMVSQTYTENFTS